MGIDGKLGETASSYSVILGSRGASTTCQVGASDASALVIHNAPDCGMRYACSNTSSLAVKNSKLVH